MSLNQGKKISVEYIEETHQYLIEGQLVPSVTTIINKGDFDDLPDEVLERIKRASLIGTAVHKATEDIDMGKSPKVDDTYSSYLVQYLLFQKEHNIKWSEIEKLLHTLEFAGTADRIHRNYEIDGEVYTLIADVKTTSLMYKGKLALQLGGYALADSFMTGTPIEKYKGAVIWLKRDKWVFRMIDIDPVGFMEKFKEYKEQNKTIDFLEE